MKTVVFLGPSLAVEHARRVLPDATYLPPARQADLLTAAINLKPQVVALIDGVFLHTPSVWHKEILFSLEAGVRVFGASSMGALRAAETDSFGMIGVGEIYKKYASGELIDDDEVALAHASAEWGYRKLSEPMVNIRATLEAARKAGVLSVAAEAAIGNAAKDLHFSSRLFPDVFELARRRGVPGDVIAELEAFVITDYVDLKARDAELLLQTIRDLPERQAPLSVRHRTAVNPGLETMYNRERQVQVGDCLLPLADIADYVALHDADFQTLNFNAMNRLLAVLLARLLHVEVTAAQIDEESDRFRRRNGIEDVNAFSEWLTANNVTESDFGLLMKEAAMCRSLHKWILYARFAERTTRLVLDQLRWENRYQDWALRASAQQSLLDSFGEGRLSDTLDTTTSWLVENHQRMTGVRFDIGALEWAEEAGFHGKAALKLGLARTLLARQNLLTLLDEALSSDESELVTESGSDGDGATEPEA